jgi:dTDP-4-dehydrorhamnose 3,5-epimerase
MQFSSTSLSGAYIVDLDTHEDSRGFFARTWCAREFHAMGLPASIVQASVSFNLRKATIRGLHFQWPPSHEGKLVRCETGAVFDVMLDLRPDSGSFLRHVSITLDAEAGNAVFIPPGVAHGFQTLADRTRVAYLMSDYFDPTLSDGVRFDDPGFGIVWPLEVTAIAQRDRAYPDFDRAAHIARYRGQAAKP